MNLAATSYSQQYLTGYCSEPNERIARPSFYLHRTQFNIIRPQVYSASSYLFLSIDYNPPESEAANALRKYENIEGTRSLHVYNNNIISYRIVIHRLNFVSNNICLSINITQTAFQTQ